MIKEKKNNEIEFLKQSLQNNEGLFIGKYEGLSVQKFNLIRREIRSHGANLKVYKNTLSKIAFKGSYAEPLSEHLEGPNFIVFTNDPASSAKALLKFAQDNPANIEIKAGFYQIILDKEKIKTIATLPSKEALIAKFVSLLKSPQVRLVFALKYPIVNLARTLKALEVKKH